MSRNDLNLIDFLRRSEASEYGDTRRGRLVDD
jgi:hypothetical protein